MNDDNLTTIGSYSQPYEAHLVQQRLRDHGIPAFIANEHTISINWLYSNALGGVQVLVPSDRAEEARRILASDVTHSFEPVFEDPIPCPACGSPDTEPVTLRRFHVAIPLALSAVASYLLGPAFIMLAFPFFFGGPGLLCHTCGRRSYIGKWPLEKIGKWAVLALGGILLLLVVQAWFMAWGQEYAWEERDWNQNGETTVMEYLNSGFVVKVPGRREACFDYYHRVTREKLKEECGFHSGLKLR
ncbi:MAG: DUF2007 domain-containing protein [Nitrospina sp.]|nr:DUF2007 domain-containing protein [Nitrospina sp.]